MEHLLGDDEERVILKENRLRELLRHRGALGQMQAQGGGFSAGGGGFSPAGGAPPLSPFASPGYVQQGRGGASFGTQPQLFIAPLAPTIAPPAPPVEPPPDNTVPPSPPPPPPPPMPEYPEVPPTPEPPVSPEEPPPAIEPDVPPPVAPPKNKDVIIIPADEGGKKDIFAKLKEFLKKLFKSK